jgi:hypothetical protein
MNLQFEYLQFSQNSVIFSQIEYIWKGDMYQDEKLKKVCDDFSLLSGEQQDYILGILQALVFAKSVNNQAEAEKSGTASNAKG